MTDYQNLKEQVVELDKRIKNVNISLTHLLKKRNNLKAYKQKCLYQIELYDGFVELVRNNRKDKK